MRWSRREPPAFQQTGFPPPPAAAPAPAAPVIKIHWVIAAFALATALLLVAALMVLKDEALRTGTRLTQSLAQVIAEQTSRTVQAVDERLKLSASRLQAMEQAGTLNQDSARAELRSQLAGLPFVRAIWVLDAQGRVSLDTDLGNIGISLADRPYFQIYRQRPGTEFFIGPVVRSRSTGTWLLSATRPLRSATGQVTGVIVAAVEPPYFEQIWSGVGLGAGGAVTLFNRDGRLMIRSPSDDTAIGMDFSLFPPFTRDLAAAPRGVFTNASRLDKRERVSAYSVLTSYPELLVVVGSPYDDMLSSWRRFAMLAAVVWLLGVLTAMALAWQVDRQTRRRERGVARFGQLAQAMPQIVFVADGAGQIRFINNRWVEYTGYPTDQAMGTGWTRLIHPDDRDGAVDSLSAAMLLGSDAEHEHRVLCADGEYRWQLVRAVPERDAQGNVITWYGTSTDIDELKRAQHQLAKQAGMLSVAGQMARMGGWAVDVADRRILWSDEASDILDMPPGSRPTLEEIYSTLSLESYDSVTRAVEACISEGTPFDVEVELTTASGTQRCVRSIGRAVRDASGKIVRIEGAQQDITERVRMIAKIRELNAGLEEKVNQRTAALRLANEQLEAFSYSVSHDLQSPLQRAASFAQLLEREINVEPGSKAAHYLARIRANTDYMTQLIDGLLSLAQVARLEMLRGTVSLSALATEILERMHAEEPERDVAWEVQPELSVSADARLMRSVMENLLGNAWKFSSRQPHAKIEFGMGKNGEFFVRDNGAGFDMAYAGKLFGAFQRLHTEQEFPGTGIGLATVARAIARQGGTVRAHAVLGQGATFCFTLPAAPPP